MTRSGLSAQLSNHQPEPQLFIHPEDAAHHGLKHQDITLIDSSHGHATMRVVISAHVKQGQLFAPIHWSDSNSSSGKLNQLVQGLTDPISGQPEMKQTPVMLKRFPFLSQAILVSHQALTLTAQPYWVKQTIQGGYCYFIASDKPPQEINTQLQDLVQPQEGIRIQANKGDIWHRFASSHNDQIQFAYILGEQLNIEELSWFELLLSDHEHAPQANRFKSLLSANPIGNLAKGKIVCTCKQVGHKTLCQTITQHKVTSLAQIGKLTQAGTGCGTCIPELTSLLEESVIQS